jgi:hypothetical protein
VPFKEICNPRRIEIREERADNQDRRQHDVKEGHKRHVKYAVIVKHMRQKCTFGPNQPEKSKKNFLWHE